MATLFGGGMIPSSVTTGVGSYTIPAGYYGHISMSTSASAAGCFGGAFNQPDVGSGAGGATANANHQLLVAGDSITVGSSDPSGQTGAGTQAIRKTTGYRIIYLNGVNACVSYASAASGSYTNTGASVYSDTLHSGALGWSVALIAL